MSYRDLIIRVVLLLCLIGTVMWLLIVDTNKEYAEQQQLAKNECRILLTYAEDRRDTLRVLGTTVRDGYVCIRLFSTDSVIH